MSATESQEILSEDVEKYSDSTKFVPVAESIRYRRRAQSAEKQVEDLNEQLAQAKSATAKLSEQISEIRLEQNLMSKLSAAGAMDLEAAVLIAKTKISSDNNADVDGVIEQLKKEKQYLFCHRNDEATAIKKTAGAKDRLQNSQTVLERAAKKAAATGSRKDLQEYLKMRRNYL
jgi:hypothetical protein